MALDYSSFAGAPPTAPPPTASEIFNSNRISNGTIFLPPGMNSVVIQVNQQGSTNGATIDLTVLDSPQDGGPLVQASGPNAVIPKITPASPGKWLVTGLLPYVAIRADNVVGSWTVTWSAATSASQATQPTASQAPYLKATSGKIAAGNVNTAVVVAFPNLILTNSQGLSDARQAAVVINNIGTGQQIESGVLTFSDVSASGQEYSIGYDIPISTPIASGKTAVIMVPLTLGILTELAASVTFAVAPTTGNVDIAIYLQGPGGMYSDPVAGRDLFQFPINATAAGVTNVVPAKAGYLVRVANYGMSSDRSLFVTWQDTNGPTDLSGPMPIDVGAPLDRETSTPSFVLFTSAGGGLDINLSRDANVGGHIVGWYEYALPIVFP